MTKRRSRIMGGVMLLIAAVYILFASMHPEMGFTCSNIITYFLYCLYLVIMIVFLIAPFREKKRYISKDL